MHDTDEFFHALRNVLFDEFHVIVKRFRRIDEVIMISTVIHNIFGTRTILYSSCSRVRLTLLTVQVKA